MNRTFRVFIRIASPIHKTFVFLKNNMGITMKNTRSADFCADQIDVITNFIVIKRVHCIQLTLTLGLIYMRNV